MAWFLRKNPKVKLGDLDKEVCSPSFTEERFEVSKKLTVLTAQHQNGTKQLSKNVGINIS